MVLSGPGAVTVARSGNNVIRAPHEVRTAVANLRRDVDGIRQPRLVHFRSASTSTTLARFLHPWFSGDAALAAETSILLPCNAMVTRLYVHFETAGTGTGTLVVNVRRNEGPTSMAVTVPATGRSGNNTRDHVAYEAGDRLAISVTPSGTVTASPTNILVALEVV